MRQFALFRSFGHRNFRLFILGQVVSLLGSWAQRLAVGWLAWTLTHSAFWVGAVSFAGLFPGVAFGPWAGSVTDSMQRYRLVQITQSAFMIQAVLLSVLTLSGLMTIEYLLLLETLLAVITAFDIPARQSLVVELVGVEDLPNAIAINSSTVNITRMLGPALAGLIIVWGGIGEAFAFNAVSYIAVLTSLSLMKVPPRELLRRTVSRRQHMLDGMAYSWRKKNMRTFLLLFFLMAMFGMPYASLMPVFADQRFGMGAEGLSWLVAASGLGATFGALTLAARKRTRGLDKALFPAGALFGVSLIMLGLTNDFWSAILLLPFCGFGMMLQMAGNNTVLQTLVSEEQRGRVMSLLSMAFQAGMPLGALWMGSMAEQWGLSLPLIIGGAICILLSVLLFIFHFRPGRKNPLDITWHGTQQVPPGIGI